jgi:TRAP-type mannitol/chloroaromatic compound transport system permease small subunit
MHMGGGLDRLLSLAANIDRLSRFFGIIAAAVVAAACAISAGNALSRYLFDLSSNAFLEIQWQMFAATFLLGAAYVLKLNEHVRVDLIYGALGPRKRLWVDVFGYVFFFFPVMFIMLEMAWPWAWASARAGEFSANAGGLPVWPAKFLLPIGFTLLTLQGLAELIRRVAALRGDIALDLSYEKPVQ